MSINETGENVQNRTFIQQVRCHVAENKINKHQSDGFKGLFI